jgi:hypothetical protein
LACLKKRGFEEMILSNKSKFEKFPALFPARSELAFGDAFRGTGRTTQEVRANGRDFLVRRIGRDFRGLRGHQPVCQAHSTVSAAHWRRMRSEGVVTASADGHAESQLFRISVPAEIIHQASWLYLRFTLSFRDAEDLLAERGIGNFRTKESDAGESFRADHWSGIAEAPSAS